LRLEVEQEYWNNIRAIVKQSLTDVNGNLREVSTVILLDESAGDEQFKCIVKETLRELLGEMPRIYGFDPLFGAAAGAAEFAWRIQEVILQSERNISSTE
jgi:hypothetical protein